MREQQQKSLLSIKRHLPQARLFVPDGGFFLWLELPAHVDATQIYREALAANISVAPGPMFSARRAYRNCLRINTGHPFTASIERAIATLGKLCSS